MTTLTKRMAEELTHYFAELGIRSTTCTPTSRRSSASRSSRDFRRGVFDCLVGINLLREGLDLPEVAVVAILDADKEGFLREPDLAHPDDRAAPRATSRAASSSTRTRSPTR